MPERLIPRWKYIALIAATIVAGLLLHSSPAVRPLTAAGRDILGDALWAAMIFWWLGALVPQLRQSIRVIITLVICTAVELSQLYHAAAIDAARETLAGQLVLGSGFDPRDFLAYAMGVFSAMMLERAMCNRREPSQLP